MASGTAPPQKRRLRHEQAALGSGRSETSGGGKEKAETRGPASRPHPTPPSAPETQLGDPGPGQPRGPRGTGFGGPYRPGKTPTGWGLAGTQAGSSPEARGEGCPQRRVAVRRRRRTRPRQRRAGPGPRGGTVPPVPPRPRGGPSSLQSRGRRRSGPRAPGTRNYAPRAGPRWGAGVSVAGGRRAPGP